MNARGGSRLSSLRSRTCQRGSEPFHHSVWAAARPGGGTREGFRVLSIPPHGQGPTEITRLHGSGLDISGEHMQECIDRRIFMRGVGVADEDPSVIPSSAQAALLRPPVLLPSGRGSPCSTSLGRTQVQTTARYAHVHAATCLVRAGTPLRGCRRLGGCRATPGFRRRPATPTTRSRPLPHQSATASYAQQPQVHISGGVAAGPVARAQVHDDVAWVSERALRARWRLSRSTDVASDRGGCGDRNCNPNTY